LSFAFLIIWEISQLPDHNDLIVHATQKALQGRWLNDQTAKGLEENNHSNLMSFCPSASSVNPRHIPDMTRFYFLADEQKSYQIFESLFSSKP